MAKQPQRGRVKTRLAKDIGQSAALRFYRFCFCRMLSCLSTMAHSHNILISLAPDKAAIDKSWRKNNAYAPFSNLNFIKQGKGDLGARLINALRAAPKGAVIFIGADCPDITKHDLIAAEKLLSSHDFVIGPAYDGGYWLIGFSARIRREKIFKNIRWSSQFAFEDSLSQMNGYRVGILEHKYDIDTGKEYSKFLQKK